MTPATSVLRGCRRPLVEEYDTALLDLDGVVYVGPHAVAHAPETLATARRAGMRLAFVTNNAARRPDTVAAHLSELGVEASPDDVVTSAQAAARLVAEAVPAGSRVLVVGGAGLRAALAEHGLVPVSSADDEPAAVVQGFAPEVGWQLLTEGAIAARRGVPWVASNLDLTIPTARGIAPGNGTLVAAVAAAAGRRPQVAGKPELPLHREAVLRTRARRPLVVGDRLDTDIEGANRAATDSLLVFTGVTDPAQLLAAAPALRPTYVSADLRGLLEPAPEVVPEGSGWRCGEWLAVVEAGRLEVTSTAREDLGGGADADHERDIDVDLDAVRAACAAAWSYADGGGEPIDLGALGRAG